MHILVLSGKSMYAIESAIGSPTYNLAKWLIREFEILLVTPPDIFVQTCVEFIKKVFDVKLGEGEI